jgi:uncharacterized membrane protein (UPF0136 family)
MKLAAVTSLIYGVLVLLGGIMGYVQAKSFPSLISGVVFGLLLLVSGWLAWGGSMPAIYVSAGAALLLALFFGYRLTATGKMMPSGMMLILSFVAVVILVYGAFSAIRR